MPAADRTELVARLKLNPPGEYRERSGDPGSHTANPHYCGASRNAEVTPPGKPFGEQPYYPECLRQVNAKQGFTG